MHLKTAGLFSFEKVADKKLTELTEHTAFNDNDKYYIVTSDGVSKFARHGVLIENLITAIEAGSTDSKFRGYKENEAAIQAIPNPKDGDGAVNLVDNHFWIYIALDVYGNPLNEWVDTGQVVTPPEVDVYPTEGNFDKVPSSGGTFEKLAGKSDVGHGHSPSETWLQEILSFYVLTSEFLTPFWAALKSVLKEGDNITFQTNETTKTLTIHAAGGGGGGDPHFLGVFPTLYDLISEHPSASPGDFADVDEGPGIDVIRYVWDDSDTQWKAGTTDSVPFASETVPGIVEQATESEFNTGTDVGGSGAPLFVPPSLIKAKFDAITVTVPNASETVKGVVEQATSLQFDAGTDTGETGAPLFVPPSLIKSKLDSVTIANASETVKGAVEEATDAEIQANTATGSTGAKLFVAVNKLWTWFRSLIFYGNLTFSTNVAYDLTGKKTDSRKLPGINANFTLTITAGQNEDACIFHVYAVKSVTTAVTMSLAGTGITHKDAEVTITALGLPAGAIGDVWHLIGKVRWTGSATEIDWVTRDGAIVQVLSASTSDIPSVGLVNSEFLLRHKQGGNAYGAAAQIGTTDAFDVQILRAGIERLAATATGARAKGAGTAAGAAFQVVNNSLIQSFVSLDNGLNKIGAGTPFSNLDIGGSVSFFYRAIAAARTLDASDYFINCTGGVFNVTLPTAVGIPGRTYIIKNSSVDVVTIATTSSQTIDGVTTQSLATQYSKIMVMSNGANWLIVG